MPFNWKIRLPHWRMLSHTKEARKTASQEDEQFLNYLGLTNEPIAQPQPVEMADLDDPHYEDYIPQTQAEKEVELRYPEHIEEHEQDWSDWAEQEQEEEDRLQEQEDRLVSAGGYQPAPLSEDGSDFAFSPGLAQPEAPPVVAPPVVDDALAAELLPEETAAAAEVATEVAVGTAIPPLAPFIAADIGVGLLAGEISKGNSKPNVQFPGIESHLQTDPVGQYVPPGGGGDVNTDQMMRYMQEMNQQFSAMNNDGIRTRSTGSRRGWG